MNRQYYTYIWLRTDGTPYYIGKGSGKRAFKPGGRRVYPPLNSLNILIQEFPTEEDAFAAEKFLISYYGRIDLGTGCLRNFSDGGEGISNPSQDIREKLSRVHKGKPFSAEHCAKIGEANRRRKLSPESCRRITLANLGRKVSVESRHKMSIARRGKPQVGGVKKHSEESKKKISMSLFGKKRGPYKKRSLNLV